MRFKDNQKEYRRLQSLERRKLYPIRHLLSQARYRAKKKGVEFSVTEEDLKLPLVCPIMGIELFHSEGRRTDNSPSIDRVDNSKGYTKENTRVISWLANGRKGDLTVEQIHRLCDYIDGRV